MFDHVVVGVSDSDAATRAFEQAMVVTRATGGTLHLVSAFGARRAAPPDMPEEFRYSIGSVDPIDWRLSQLAGAARAAAIPVTTHSVLADPVEALTRVAAQEQADLIVVGADQSHGTRHRHPVTDGIVRQAGCAVLVVEAEVGTKVMAAVSGDSLSH
jgi:nucleotide-binding universal stress UspA family protein